MEIKLPFRRPETKLLKSLGKKAVGLNVPDNVEKRVSWLKVPENMQTQMGEVAPYTTLRREYNETEGQDYIAIDVYGSHDTLPNGSQAYYGLRIALPRPHIKPSLAVVTDPGTNATRSAELVDYQNAVAIVDSLFALEALKQAC